MSALETGRRGRRPSPSTDQIRPAEALLAVDTMLPMDDVLAFFGGESKPIHYSTLYRGINDGRFPKGIRIGPNTVRWSLRECVQARQKLMAAREEPQPAPAQPDAQPTGEA